MNRTSKILCLLSLGSVGVSNLFGQAPASPSPAAAGAPTTAVSPATAAISPAAQQSRAFPYRGKIASVDQNAKTFTVAGKDNSRVFKISDRTVITKGGNSATAADIVAADEVRGSYWKGADDSLEAKTVKLGPRTEAEKESKKKKKAGDSAASPSP